HQSRLVKGYRGAKNYHELLAAYNCLPDQPGPPDGDVEAEENVSNAQKKDDSVFAIPSMPKKKNAGPSCSTPISGKDASMRTLKGLDISQVFSNVESSFTTVKCAGGGGEPSLQKTFTMRNVEEEEQESIQKTFTVRNGEEESLQKTFVVAEADGGASSSSSSSLQKTFTVRNEEEPLQGTFVVEKEKEAEPETEHKPIPQPQEPPKTHNRPKKTNLEKREGRMADLTSSMMMGIDDTPSPGARHFKPNARKKLRESLQTPPRGLSNRMSLDSDKDKTISMLSVAESSGRESMGSSYADPVSIHHQTSHISSIPEEHEEEQEEVEVEEEAETTVQNSEASVAIKTPPRAPRLTQSSIERRRANQSALRISTAPKAAEGTFLTTPTAHNYQKPTFSSLVKSKDRAECTELLTELNKNRTPRRTVPPVEEPAQELGHVAEDLEALSISVGVLEKEQQEPRPLTEDVDFEDREEPVPDDESVKKMLRRVGLLSDSIATVNTPGHPRAAVHFNDTTAVDQWRSDEDDDEEEEEEGPSRRRQTRRGGKKQEVGLQLAKRRIIEPEQAPDGIRRSSRVRVKPLRSWLGERLDYAFSPNGTRRLKGVNDVFIKDKRMCKYRTADCRLAMEREQREKARKRERAAKKRARLALDQSQGRRMDESQEDIVTSSDEE
uniref:Uncharacterized protein n=1 Tax=Caenorhabditis japonica TaxID=281687 RepID=A0A8R1DKR4_CAEJA